ncbi:hypothetical protein [Rhodoblastus sp.]|uniref:hypothetical protein n=1 Tax=Rhodoblastus sp. TaxID=1962975 RepID=UPI003F9503F1
MLGIFGAHAQDFLFWFVVLTVPVFVVPLTLTPMTWARIFQWRLPEDPDLAFYFGRCLGALAVAIEYVLWRGSRNVTIAPVAVGAMGILCAIMVAVHIDGAIRKIQPWTETAEIAFWLAATIGCVLFYPVG